MTGTPAFETVRLLAKEWHSLSADGRGEQDLATVVSLLLTANVTAALPPAWQGPYSQERAQAWIEERDREGATLLVLTKATKEPVGLVLFFEMADEHSAGTDVRLGYLIAESAWGNGFATEIVGGFVAWCRTRDVRSITGGVEPGNAASIRVLEKNGFVASPSDDPTVEELFFTVQL